MADMVMELSRRIFGIGVAAVGLVCLLSGDFILGQQVSSSIPHRTLLAYLAGALLLLAGTAVEWQRTIGWAAAALTFYYSFVVLLIMDGSALPAQFTEYGTYSSGAEQVAITAAAVIILVDNFGMDAALSARLIRMSQLAFGVCAVLFGGAHFVYLNLTAPLVPRWLPPSQNFWAFATGACFIAAGIGILARVQARLAAVLVTIMMASFAVLIHTPMLLANPSRMNWTESVMNFVLFGSAWIIAESLSPPLNHAEVPSKSSCDMSSKRLT